MFFFTWFNTIPTTFARNLPRLPRPSPPPYGLSPRTRDYDDTIYCSRQLQRFRKAENRRGVNHYQVVVVRGLFQDFYHQLANQIRRTPR